MNEPIDPLTGDVDRASGSQDRASGNGDSRAASSRALMVREYEAGLAPYVPTTMAGAYVDGAPSGVNFVQLLHSLRRRWLLAICAGLLVGVPLAAVVWLVTPENYEVIAWLHVGDPPTFTGRGASPLNRNATEYEQYRKTQSARIKSPLVLNAALNKPGVMDLPMMRAQGNEPLKFLESELIVVSPLESEVLQIKMRGKDARQLVKIVNAVKESYLLHIVAAEKQQNYKRRDILEQRHKETMADILDKRNKVLQLAQKLNAQDLAQVRVRSGLLLNRSHTLLRELSEARKDLRDILVKIAMVEENGGVVYVPTEEELDLEIMKDPLIQRYEQQLSSIQQGVGMQQGLARRGARDGGVQQMTMQANAIQQQLEERRAELRQPIMQRLQRERAREEGVVDPERLKTNARMLEEEVAKMQAEYDKVSTEVATMTQESADVDAMLGEIEQLQANANELSGQLDALKIELSLPTRVTSLDDASVPEGTNPITRYVLTALAGLSGLFLGAATVVAMEYHAHRLNTSSELGTTVGLRVLGTVPSLRALSSAKGLNGSAGLHGILAESVDRIRTILLQQSADDAPHVLLISSAGDREGKTTVASQLAASLARGGRRTLLIDGDLRSPTVHTTFGAAPDPGLCEVLRGEVELAGAIQPTSIDGLMLVAGGQCDYHAIAALSKDVLRDVLQKARDQFEFVVIDAAPVLIYADTLLMGAHADAAVLSVRRDVSQLHKVYEAKDRMESVGIRVLGAVVNGISETNRRPAFALPATA